MTTTHFERAFFWSFLGLGVLALAALLLTSCGVLTEALAAMGVPVEPKTVEAAKEVDKDLGAWLYELLWFCGGCATTEGARKAHRVNQKRKAAKAASKPPTH